MSASDWTVRDADPDSDFELYRRFFAWLETDPQPMPEARWRSEMAASTLFLEREYRELAYGWYETLGLDGYVRHLAVDPGARREGLGRATMLEVARRLRAAGCERWQLNVKRDNAPAIALYRSLGLEIDYPTTVIRVAWSAVASLPRPAYSVIAREVAASEDAALERAFGLPAGRLANARRNPDVLVVRVVDAHADRELRFGLACFDPHYPGCFPFRVRELEHARPMLELLEGKRPPTSTWIQLVVEDNPALVATLRRAGAETIFDIVHMTGALPA